MATMTLQQAFDLAVQYHQSGRLAEADHLYRQILARQPNHANALHYMGLIAHQMGRNDIALELINRAIVIKPEFPEAHNHLGIVLKELGQIDAAIIACHRAIALMFNFPEAHNSLANALKDGRRLEEAIAAYRQSIALNPNVPEVHNNLGNALREMGHLDESIRACRRCIALDPRLPEAHSNLGNALHDRKELDAAVMAYCQAIALRANYPEAHLNLGNVLKDQGQVGDAIASYRQAIALRPKYPEAHSNLVFALLFHSLYDARAIAHENDDWNRQYAEPLRKFIQPHSNDRNSERRLRIGYVSPDFRDHVVGRNLLPLLRQHDRDQFEITGYANVGGPDAMTSQFQQNVDRWRNIAGLSDEEASEQIRADGIDILVDLTLHMAHHRLLIFARKPAPVQVTFAGYPGSTGLKTIDYRLSDPYLDPPGMDESIYSEKTVRLPDSFWCYDPLDCSDIVVNPLPALEKGVVTFGCLNNFCKINDQTLGLWAAVMRQVEGSRLMLLAHEGSHRQRTLDWLCREGIDATRVGFISFQPRRMYLEQYHRIDLGLDSFPYNGHTTSLDSLWMGVPVVTWTGATAVARAGWSQLSNLGLTELAGQTSEQFVQIAVDLANDLARLSHLRSTLRQRMERSPLMDAARFARNIESAYRQMWRTWSTSHLVSARVEERR